MTKGAAGRAAHRVAILGLGLVTLAGLVGCWSTVPIGHRALVQIIAVDPGRGGRTTYAFVIPTPAELTQTTGAAGGSNAQSQVQAVTVQAPSLALAFSEAETLLSRNLYLGQTQQILFSEKLSPRVFYDTLDSLAQVAELDQSQSLYAVRGRAVQAALAPDPQEVFPSAYLEHLNSCTTCSNVHLRVTLMNTFLKTRSPYADVVLPEIRATAFGPTVRGLAFYRDGRYILSLDSIASGIYGLALGRTEKISLDVPVPGLGIAHLRALQAAPSTRVRVVRGRVVAALDLQVRGTVVGLDPDRGLSFRATHAAIETATAELLERRLAGIFTLLLGRGLDPLRLGERLYSDDPAAMPRHFNLARAMQRARITLTVHVQLQQSGEVR